MGDQNDNREPSDKYGTFSNKSDPQLQARDIFLPIDHKDGSNPDVHVENPYPGIFIYRFSEGFNYPNANHYLDHLTNYIFAHTKRTNPNSYPRPGDRPWNDPGPRRGKKAVDRPDLSTLKAIILDLSSVNNVDITSVQQLIDVRNQLDRYTTPERVDWHLACINNRWTKRALASAGFGYPNPLPGGSDDNDFSHYKPIFSVAGIGGSSSAAQFAEDKEIKEHERDLQRSRDGRISNSDDKIQSPREEGAASSRSSSDEIARLKARVAAEGRGGQGKLVHGVNRPLFHTDLTNALESAIANVQAREAFEAKGGAGIGQEP